MDQVVLGRTGLEVSVVALGAGGPSRLGLRNGATEEQAIELLRAAIDRGISIIDTAPVYGTEPVVGAALAGLRDKVVLSSKLRPTLPDSSNDSSAYIEPAMVRESVEASLAALRTDRIEILHLHGVRPHQYPYCLEHLVPELLLLQEEGKIGFLGITESFGVDAEREVMRQATEDGIWDVLMLGHNFINPSAEQLVLPRARAKQLGVMCMYAVRGALATADGLRKLVEKLVVQGEVAREALDPAEPLGMLLADGVAHSYTEAAYRFCRHTSGIDVVMTGTGSLDHLDQNIQAIHAAPLPPEILSRLSTVFGRVHTATGDPV
ncbi:aldo/keto reductase [Devosia sp. 1566]|uniref:aldo/keto reductase n=1 Tax=Devosia sp. 1566 TaxID=2499144 RepID=UPI000FD6BA50|nr:aldo/keto reductase [Devosia sp. 1566]